MVRAEAMAAAVPTAEPPRPGRTVWAWLPSSSGGAITSATHTDTSAIPAG